MIPTDCCDRRYLHFLYIRVDKKKSHQALHDILCKQAVIIRYHILYQVFLLLNQELFQLHRSQHRFLQVRRSPVVQCISDLLHIPQNQFFCHMRHTHGQTSRRPSRRQVRHHSLLRLLSLHGRLLSGHLCKHRGLHIPYRI